MVSCRRLFNRPSASENDRRQIAIVCPTKTIHAFTDRRGARKERISKTIETWWAILFLVLWIPASYDQLRAERKPIIAYHYDYIPYVNQILQSLAVHPAPPRLSTTERRVISINGAKEASFLLPWRLPICRSIRPRSQKPRRLCAVPELCFSLGTRCTFGSARIVLRVTAAKCPTWISERIIHSGN
jgi:hypothetical protein